MNISSTSNPNSAYNYISAKELTSSNMGLSSGENESTFKSSDIIAADMVARNKNTIISAFINNPSVKETSELTKILTLSTQHESSVKSLKEFETIMKQVLVPDSQGNLHEEQMQFAIAYFLLAERNQELGKQYLETFNGFIGSGTPPMSVEDAVKKTLKKLVSAENIPKADAEAINGISFRVAQLDNNLDALYDNRGSVHDITIAVMPEKDAIKKAFEAVKQIETGQITAENRSLDAPSNSVSGGNLMAVVGGGSSGFLWKPISESDGKLAVLLPAAISNSAISTEIHSELPPSDATLVEVGRNTNSFHNGRRIFRFSQPGADYPDNCYIVAKLDNGATESYKISESDARVE